MIGFDGLERISGTKIHVAVESNGLPISITTGPGNVHDSAKLIDAIENISEFVDDGAIKETAAVYADRGYDSNATRDYLKNRNLTACIPFRNSGKSLETKPYKKYNSARCIVERFFGWLKNGFHRAGIRYKKKCDSYLGFVYLACIMVYWRVLR